jgi:hypothetical protein
MPSSFVNIGKNAGVYEIQAAPSNTNIFYMMYLGYVFKSTNKGATWTQTSFAQVQDGSNGSYAQYGQKIAIDPNNANVVYVGSPNMGLFVTTNGGTSWTLVSSIPVSGKDSSGNYYGVTGILFDPVVGGTTNGNTNTIFASSGTNGVYESTNAGASWTKLSGGPATVANAAVSSTGVYYATDGTNLWSYNNAKWTNLVTNGGNGIQAVAVNPLNSNEIVTVAPGGNFNISYNAGSTWSGINWSTTASSPDIPWLAAANTYYDMGGIVFNPAVENQLMMSAGTGVWNTNVPTSGFTWNTPTVYNDQSLGIEQLVANSIVVPQGGNPVLASWDRPFFYITNPNTYPSTYSPVDSSNIVAGWSIDYASSTPSFLVGIAEWWGTEESGYSTNGGQTWTKFASFPPGASSSYMGGTIAASTTQNIVWAPADGYQPYYTLNGGNTWTGITLPGVSSWSGFDFA